MFLSNLKKNINYKLVPIYCLNIISFICLIILAIKNVKFLFGNYFQTFVKNSDYFINYSSGFIKRGLDGEIIHRLTILTGFSPVGILKVYYLFFFIIITFIVLYGYIKSKVNLFFIFSPYIFLFTFVNFRLVHLTKDLEIIVFSYLVLYYFLNHKNKYLFNLFLCIGILIHEEIFIFLSIPLFILSFYTNHNQDFIVNTKKFFIKILPSAILFIVMVFIFNGSKNDINEIYYSWKSITDELDGLKFNYGLFDGNSVIVFYSNHVVGIKGYVGLGLLFIINFIFMTCGAFVYYKKNFLLFFYIALFQNFSIFLVCIVASDFGRWFFVPNTIFLMLIFLLNKKTLYFKGLDNLINNEIIIKFYRKHSLNLLVVLFLFGGMPYCGFNIYRYLFTNPFNVLFNFISI